MLDKSFTRKRNLQIEGLRGLAAIFVVIYHFACRFQELYCSRTVPVIENWGAVGVIIFLMLSAYFNSNNANTVSWATILKRVIRLWPCYVVSITLTFLFLLFFELPGRMVTLYDYLLNIVFLNGFVDGPYVDGAHWYITALLSTIVVLGCFNLAGKTEKCLTYILWMGLIYCLGLYDLGWVARLMGGSYFGIVSAGVSLRFLSAKGTHKMNRKWALLFVAAVLFTMAKLGKSFGFILICAFPVLYLVIHEKIPVLEKRFFVQMGKISYPLYLIHQNVGMAIQYHLMNRFGSFFYWFIVVSTLVTLVLGVLLYIFVEKTAQKALQKMF